MDILEITKRASDGAYAFAKKLEDGWYFSDCDEEGELRHDRHVLIHVRNHAYDLKQAAIEIERLRDVIGSYDIALQKATWRQE